MRTLISLLVFMTSALAHADSIGLHVNPARGLTPKQCETLLRAYVGVRNPKLSYLEGTFNRDQGGFDCVAEFLSRFKDEPHVLQVYADNSTCRRPPRYCEETEIAPNLRAREYSAGLQRGDRNLLRSHRRRAIGIRDFITAYASSNATIVYAYSLEDDLSNRAFTKLARVVEPIIPDQWIRLRNPNVKNADALPIRYIDVIELHAATRYRGKARFGYSNDGVDVNFGNGYRPLRDNEPVASMFSRLRKVQRDKNTLFVWLWWNNQGVDPDGEFIPPSRRRFQIRSRDIALINKELLK